MDLEKEQEPNSQEVIFSQLCELAEKYCQKRKLLRDENLLGKLQATIKKVIIESNAEDGVNAFDVRLLSRICSLHDKSELGVGGADKIGQERKNAAKTQKQVDTQNKEPIRANEMPKPRRLKGNLARKARLAKEFAAAICEQDGNGKSDSAATDDGAGIADAGAGAGNAKAHQAADCQHQPLYKTPSSAANQSIVVKCLEMTRSTDVTERRLGAEKVHELARFDEMHRCFKMLRTWAFVCLLMRLQQG
jgi:hypothetical protein